MSASGSSRPLRGGIRRRRCYESSATYDPPDVPTDSTFEESLKALEG